MRDAQDILAVTHFRFDAATPRAAAHSGLTTRHDARPGVLGRMPAAKQADDDVYHSLNRYPRHRIHDACAPRD